MSKKEEKVAMVEGAAVETTAVITQLEIGKTEDKISFTALDFKDEGDSVLRAIIKAASPVAVIIDPATEDPNFPKIRVEGFLTKLNIAKTCDKPTIKKVQFSSSQVSQIHGYIRTNEEIKLRIVELQGELFNGDPVETPEATA